MRIAITGGIGEGKSTVLRTIQDLGFVVDSSDETARRVRENPEVKADLAVALGYDVLPDRDVLRQRLANDPAARRAMNRILHPRIVAEMDRSAAVFAEIPLLFETCRQGAFDEVWVVTCGLDEQRRRLMLRYGEANVVDRLLATQLPTSVKEVFADEIIRTISEPTHVQGFVSALVASRSLR